MIAALARVVRYLLMEVKKVTAVERAILRNARKVSKLKWSESRQKPSLGKTGEKKPTPWASSKAVMSAFATESCPSVMYDLTTNNGPKVTFKGRVVTLEYGPKSKMNAILRRTAEGHWDILEAGGDNVSGRLRSQAVEAIDQLYTRYVNDSVLLDT